VAAGGPPRPASLIALGIAGTNAFVILEEAPRSEAAAAAIDAPAHLFTLSAQTDAALRASIERHRAWLPDASAPLADICFTLTHGRTHFPRRFAAAVSSIAELRDALTEGAEPVEGPSVEPGARRLVFLFSGQASQYAGMGAELYREEPVFRRIVDRCGDILRDELERPLEQVLFGDGDDGVAIDQTVYTQPALFAVQAALVELWRSWGIAPDMVLGHSVGEFAAAWCAGVYSLEEGLRLTAARARLMQALPPHGTMASVFADATAVATAIERFDSDKLAIAAVNAPHNTVISGERESVRAAVGYFESLGIECRPLTVSHAFHSPLMAPALDELGRVAAAVAGRDPQSAWVSTLSSERMSGAPDARYWRAHARDPVRFMQAMETLRQMGATDFVDIGPGHALLALGRQCRAEDGLAWLGSLDPRGERRRMLASLGELYRRGSTVDWDLASTRRYGRRVLLPTYAFERRRF
jgi:acyl transferase domain-containing protein